MQTQIDANVSNEMQAHIAVHYILSVHFLH